MSMDGSGPSGFAPGRLNHGVANPPQFKDAADALYNKSNLPPKASGEGLLLLADGGRFEGTLFGAEGFGEGELVFTTGMMGYQESLTDPSWAGQILTFTYPLIGNYGIHGGKSESRAVWPKGVVVRHAMKDPDHRDSIGTVSELLQAHGVPGIENIDTRAITRRVRELGTVLCIFGPKEKESEMKKRLEVMTSPELDDLVDLVSIDEPVLLNPGATNDLGTPLPRIGALDCGVKYNILRNLCQRFEVLWCPPDVDLETLNGFGIQALFCSNGPGDPAHPGKATIARYTLANAVASGLPVMGICLGHQLMGLASGLKTYKMRYGHRGANQPVVDLKTRACGLHHKITVLLSQTPNMVCSLHIQVGQHHPKAKTYTDTMLKYATSMPMTRQSKVSMSLVGHVLQSNSILKLVQDHMMLNHCSTDLEKWLMNTFEVMLDAKKGRSQYHSRTWFRSD